VKHNGAKRSYDEFFNSNTEPVLGESEYSDPQPQTRIRFKIERLNISTGNGRISEMQSGFIRKRIPVPGPGYTRLDP
jgi:hypothetical protein